MPLRRGTPPRRGLGRPKRRGIPDVVPNIIPEVVPDVGSIQQEQQEERSPPRVRRRSEVEDQPIPPAP